MPIDPVKRLERLESLLFDLPSEAMLGSELDGFVAGILVCPAPIPPSEWLPVVWDADEALGGAPVFETQQQARETTTLVMAHHDAVAAALLAGGGRYQAVFDVDTRHDETLWEVWVDGFSRAMALRPASWAGLAQADPTTRAALAGLQALIDVAGRTGQSSNKAAEEITLMAPDLIPGWVEDLYAHRIGQARSAVHVPAVPARAKPGRNEPCVCGSGRKYKKCCGAN